MSPSQIIVFAAPVFQLLITIEFIYGHIRQRQGRGRNTYRLNDAIASINLGMLSQISGVFMGALRIGIYTVAYSYLALTDLLAPQTTVSAFWLSPMGWVLALMAYDFCYYWQHRMSHEVAVLWASHAVHHQSQDYNLSTALRQTSSGALLGWVFYLPMALAGVPPLVFGIVAMVDLLYQFWVHTEHVGKLGWFDRWFCSPSNHRAHHAVNDAYIDKNYGGIFIIWDRLFGTFKEEDDAIPCVYGTRGALNSFDPLWANAEVYWALAQDSWHARSWGDKLRIWLKPPGWRPAELQARRPKPAFDIQQTHLFNPAISPALLWFGTLQFFALLPCVMLFLWRADSTPQPVMLVWLAVLVTALWAVGGVLQGRMGALEALTIEAAALATATATLGMVDLHYMFKPLALGLAMVMAIVMTVTMVSIAMKDRATSTSRRFDAYLALALALSFVGDCVLMFPSYFVPGLVAFLLAHLSYIARFKRGVPWFPSKAMLGVALAYAVGMFSFLAWGGLPAALHVPVAVYALVIALMASQAVGRALLLRDVEGGGASVLIAVGALFFVLSDTLLAINKFVTPLGVAGLDGSLWVLATYYVAQLLLIKGCASDANTALQKDESIAVSA